MFPSSALLLLLLAGGSQAQQPPTQDPTLSVGLRYGGALVPNGKPFQVNGTEGTQDGAAIAHLASGGFVVAYEDVNASRVFACVYDIDGAQVVPEFQLNLDTDSAQGSVKVSSLANGGFVAVWRRNSATGSNSTEVVGRTFSGQGIGTSGVFVVTRAAQQTSDHQVAGLVGGNITVTWMEGDGVLCNVYAPSGDAMYATPVTIRNATVELTNMYNTTNLYDYYLRNQGLTATNDGGFVAMTFLASKRTAAVLLATSFAPVRYTSTVDIVQRLPKVTSNWREKTDDYEGSLYIAVAWKNLVYFESAISSLVNGVVIATRYPSESGWIHFETHDFDSNATSRGWVSQTIAMYSRALALSRFAGGGFLLTWREETAAGQFVVKGKIHAESGYDSSGADPLVLSGPIDQSGGDTFATSCVIGDDRVVVAYRSGQAVSGQMYTRTVPPYPTLLPVGEGYPLVRAAEQVQVSGTEGAHVGASVAALESGGFVVAYEDVNASRVFACVYDIDGTQVVPEFQLSTDTGMTQGSVKVSSLANGGFVAVWRRTASTVVGRTFSGQGIGTSGEFIVTRAAQQTSDHQVAGLVSRNITIAWTEEGVGVLCNVYAPSGDAMYATPVVVNPWAAFNYTNPAEVTAVEVVEVVALGNGGFAVGIDKMAYSEARGDNVMAQVVEVLTADARPVQSLPYYWPISFDDHKAKMHSVGGGLALASNRDGFAVATADNYLSWRGAISTFSNNGTVLGAQGWDERPISGYAMNMFPSGGLFVTGESTYHDGFGKNLTVLLSGQVFSAAANHAFHAIGNYALVAVSNVETKFVADTAILSDSRVVVVGDTNYHGGAHVYFQIYDVRGLTADTAAPDTAAPQTHANTTAPTTVSPGSLDTRQPAAMNDSATPESPAPDVATPGPVTPLPASVPSTAAPQAHVNSTAPETSAPHTNTTAPTTVSPVSLVTHQPGAMSDSAAPETPDPDASTATGSPDLQTAQPSASPDRPATPPPRSDATSTAPSAAPTKGAGSSDGDGLVLKDLGIVVLALAGTCVFVCGAMVGVGAARRLPHRDTIGVGNDSFVGLRNESRSPLLEEELDRVTVVAE